MGPSVRPPPPAAPPPPPPNPPMFGSQAVKKKGGAQAGAPASTFLGGALANPTNTGQKTLLGQ